jgi:ATP-dependent RNA helicase RhlB
MLDMGFIPDVKRIVSQLPRKGERQTLMFSATLDDSILRLASGWLADPYVVESEPDQLVSGNIDQRFYSVSRDEKLAVTLHILNNMEFERLIIFGNRKDVNLRLQYDLARYGHLVPVLSGDIPQEKRIRILEKFRSGEEKVVIATDVAARGIHVDNVSLVINYDLPERSEDYIHRIGRTGRAGNKGTAISFLCEYGAYYLPAIEELLKVQFPSELPPEDMLVLPEPVANAKLPGRPSGQGKGGRPVRRRR